MTYIILGSVLVVLMVLTSISFYVKRQVIQTLKSYGIHSTWTKDGMTYQVKLIHMTHGDKLTINSPYVLEIKRGPSNTLIQVNLHVPTLVVVYPSKERIRFVLNENEMTFINPKDLVYQSYVITLNQLETFLG